MNTQLSDYCTHIAVYSDKNMSPLCQFVTSHGPVITFTPSVWAEDGRGSQVSLDMSGWHVVYNTDTWEAL